jgi:serine/threonine-protein kinase
VATRIERPKIVGRYAIYGQIAAGGMAAVHLGRLLGPVGFLRTVAVKRLHPQFASDPEFVAMFLDEARLAARIRHPNVVQTLDVVAAEGELFLVMDYVQGETLSRLRTLAVQQGEAIPLRVATSVVCGALHGLHSAHEANSDRGESLGIVHRDVSPQNILVGTDGIPRLLDFGVAKAIGRAHATREGQLKGKLAYMAPEQLEGQATRRTDIFAASVVLWEALTGERLFEGDDERGVVGKVLKLEIAAPSARMAAKGRAIEATREQLDKLDAVTLRGLARRPEDRFDTAREMSLALERCVGVASPAEVGAWVERIAGPVLRKRSEHVAEIEVDSASPVELTVNSSSEAESEPEKTVPTLAGLRPEGLEISSPTISGATTPSHPTRSRRHGGWAILIAGLGATTLMGLAASRAFTRAPQPVTQASTVAPLAASSSSVGEATSAPSSAPVEAPPASVQASAKPAAAHPTPVVAPRRPPHSSNCDPPYVVDSAGHQRFKEECFR